MAFRNVAKNVQKVLMVPPTYFSVDYVINPWMGGVVDKEKAMKQWTTLKSAIELENVEVNVLEHVKNLPDMVFVCNAGLAYKNKVYLTRFKHPERNGEEPYYLDWFAKNGYEIFGDKFDIVFEGYGDAFFSDEKTLWCGWGQRSDPESVHELADLGKGEFEIVPMELITSQFYHLDTCMSPFSPTGCLYYPGAFSKAGQEEIKKRLPDSIIVDADEANSFVCNALTINNTVLVPVGMKPKTKEALNKFGFKVKEFDMSEFMKAGGGVHCLVMVV
uniref:Amidinotransferase n=1 Tax=Rhabditophanes sp. KR3021 TaxID=114890 RepID=A0AC35UE83_9BILA